jgi:hypothetical protein
MIILYPEGVIVNDDLQAIARIIAWVSLTGELLPVKTFGTAPWRLSNSTWGETQNYDWQAAVLPFGSIEPHNTHLP